MDYLIETIGLTKSYPKKDRPSPFHIREGSYKKTIVLDGVDIKVKESEIFCLLGPNGSGKTTLLKILATLILPTKGTACINGFEIVSHPMGVKASIGLVSSEERSFYWRLTGRENLEFYATFYNLKSRAAKDRIGYLINLLKIESPDRRVGEYSAGMRQRLGIARSLLHNPPVLLMDEPTKSLDLEFSNELRLFIKDYLSKREKKAIILTTHNLHEVEQICDRIGLLRKGRLVASGTIEELKAKAGLPPSASLEDIYIESDSSLRSE